MPYFGRRMATGSGSLLGTHASRVLRAATVFTVFFAGVASACSFHGYQPRKTFVQSVLESAELVLARPAASNPFQFSQIEVLMGSWNGGKIPLLVDTATRRRLSVSPRDQVLLSRDSSGEWTRLAYIDAAMAPILAETLANQQAWSTYGSEERARFFANLLRHPDQDVHHLALRELDTMSYASLRQLELSFDADRLLSRLNNLGEADLKPIRVLLLGLRGDTVPIEHLRNGVELSLKSTGPMLGAYSVALLEQGGAVEVEWLARTHLIDRTLPIGARQLLVEALSIQMNAGSTEAQKASELALAKSVMVDPELAYLVARQNAANDALIGKVEPSDPSALLPLLLLER